MKRKSAIKYQWYRPLFLSRAWAQMSAAAVERMDETYGTWAEVKERYGYEHANRQLVMGFELDARASLSLDHGPLFNR